MPQLVFPVVLWVLGLLGMPKPCTHVHLRSLVML
jgi:hypothetical protein